MLSDLDDSELIARVGAPASPEERSAALSMLYERYHRQVLSRCAGLVDDYNNALDLAHDTFEAAIYDLCRGKRPERLGPWLGGIARNRAADYRRTRRPLRGGSRGLDPLTWSVNADEDIVLEAEERQAGTQARQAYVDQLLERVVETFTELQQAAYRLSIQEGLKGDALAQAMGTSSEQASRHAYEIKQKVFLGFGALVLAEDGRTFCPDLAAILNIAAWDGVHFTARLRDRIVKHIDKCKTCDNCATCNETRRRLLRPLAPVLIPVVGAVELRARVADSIRLVAETAPGSAEGATPPDVRSSLAATGSDPADPRPADAPPTDPRRPAAVAEAASADVADAYADAIPVPDPGLAAARMGHDGPPGPELHATDMDATRHAPQARMMSGRRRPWAAAAALVLVILIVTAAVALSRSSGRTGAAPAGARYAAGRSPGSSNASGRTPGTWVTTTWLSSAGPSRNAPPSTWGFTPLGCQVDTCTYRLIVIVGNGPDVPYQESHATLNVDGRRREMTVSCKPWHGDSGPEYSCQGSFAGTIECQAATTPSPQENETDTLSLDVSEAAGITRLEQASRLSASWRITSAAASSGAIPTGCSAGSIDYFTTAQRN